MNSDEGAKAVVTLLFLVGLAVFFVVDCNKRNECVESGGYVEVTGHQTVMIPVSCGDGCTTYVPQEIEEWRCAHDDEDRYRPR